jgi:hypothetical protein
MVIMSPYIAADIPKCYTEGRRESIPRTPASAPGRATIFLLLATQEGAVADVDTR